MLVIRDDKIAAKYEANWQAHFRHSEYYVENKTAKNVAVATMDTPEAPLAKQQKQIDALALGLQKVSNQIGLSQPASQLVANP